MPRASPTLPEVRAKTRSTVAVCMPVLNRFMPLITQSEPCLTAVVSMKVASEPCSGSVRPKPMRSVPREHALDVAVLLLLRAEAVQQQGDREVADDRALVLQVVVQAEPLVREMLADQRHGEVGAVLAAQRLGQAEAQMAGLVGAPLHLGQQLLPFVARLAVIVPVGAGMLAAMVEEADIVVLALQRPDLALDERVELSDIGRDLRGNVEIHECAPPLWRSPEHLTRPAGRPGSGCRRLLPPGKRRRRRDGGQCRGPRRGPARCRGRSRPRRPGDRRARRCAGARIRERRGRGR